MGFVTTQWPNKSLQATPPKLMKAAHSGRGESCHTASYKAVHCGIGLERRGTLMKILLKSTLLFLVLPLRIGGPGRVEG